jgi:hypothetical protein
MKLAIQLVAIASLSIITACGAGNSEVGAEEDNALAPSIETTVPAARFSAASIDKAKSLIKAESKVVDLVYDPTNVVEWAVAVNDDGSKRYGYAGYICMLLRNAGAYDDEVEVRIVDAAKIAEFKDAYRDYSLGTVRCQNGDHFD